MLRIRQNNYQPLFLNGLIDAIFAFIVWLFGLPVSATPIRIKYLTDASTEFSVSAFLHYFLSDRECTFIFVVLGFMLLLEGDRFLYKNSKYAEMIVKVARIFTLVSTLVYVIFFLVFYTLNATSEVLWTKLGNSCYDLNLVAFVTVMFLGVVKYSLIFYMNCLSLTSTRKGDN